jgi:hypothetical protein
MTPARSVGVALVLQARVSVERGEHDCPSPMHVAGERVARESGRLAVEHAGEFVAEGETGQRLAS